MTQRRKSWRVVLVLMASVVLTALAILLHRVADAVRGTPVHDLVGEPGQEVPPLSDSTFLELAASISQIDLEPGHTVEVLNDQAIFDRLLADLGAARRSITLHIYYCEPGTLGNRIAEVLSARARAGVRVLFLADDFGCGALVSEVGAAMTAAGVQVVLFRPVRWYTLHRAQHRNHARTVVIDGEVAYTGGFGIADKWTTGSPEQLPWRDAGVRFTGPSVRVAQATFLASWAEATGDLLTGEMFYSQGTGSPEAGAVAGFLYSQPVLGTTVAERLLAVTLAAADRTLYLANSYFVPTPVLADLLMEAARRGVDVRILIPGEETDIPSTRWAARSFYEAFLTAGIRVFEYRPTMMHAKTVVADGVWSTVGSLNFDNRSIRLNDESGLVVYSQEVGARLDSIFLADLSQADEITLQSHRRRGFLDRVRERWYRRFASLL